MAKISQFGGVPGASSGAGRDCLPFEAMLVDAIDGTLSVEEQARFEEHLASCADCPVMLANAQRGQALLEMLRPEKLEPSPALLERIFDQTTGQRTRDEEAARAQRRAAQEAASLLGRPATALPAVAPAIPAPVAPVAAPGKVLPFRTRLQTRLQGVRHVVFQPRFAMTAAMAFFSIALTLNLSGIRVSQLRASDLKPSNVKRGVYEARARVVRYYANLRVVYELESRVHDLQRSDDDNHSSGSAPASKTPSPEANPQPGTQPATQESPANGTAPAGKDKGKDDAPAVAPGRGNARNRPRGGTSRCMWPLPGLQEVRLEVSPVEGTQHLLAAAPHSTISEPQGKRGLV